MGHSIGLWQPIGICGPRHVTVVAGSGAGKTRWLMGWLGKLHKDASCFVIDYDGQMVNALGPALERDGHKILTLDPYRLSRFPGACWNARDEITAAVKRHGKQAAVCFAHTLAEALLRDDNSHQPVFATTAPNVAAISKRSDFVAEDLKTLNPCVFVGAPVTVGGGSRDGDVLNRDGRLLENYGRKLLRERNWRGPGAPDARLLPTLDDAFGSVPRRLSRVLGLESTGQRAVNVDRASALAPASAELFRFVATRV